MARPREFDEGIELDAAVGGGLKTIERLRERVHAALRNEIFGRAGGTRET